MMRNIPTNIVTGFLGAGKTTAILHLLKTKPKNERWAILVNEFGEVGVDGALFTGDASSSDVFIKEVPGGCMCCAAGLPMQIALNRLLANARPHRLLIEPTGLGHPKEIVALLRSAPFQAVLKLYATLTLVDARHIRDERYRENAIFNQQLAIADVVIANKHDLASSADQIALQEFLDKRHPNKILAPATFGQIDFALLHLPNDESEVTAAHFLPPEPLLTVDLPRRLPRSGYLRMENRGDGHVSYGWLVSPALIFDRSKLFNWLSEINVERVKGIFITEDGIFALNKAGATLTEITLDDTSDSRVEIIHNTKLDAHLLEQQLLACTVAPPQ